jgi:hypothetical protein
VNLAARTSPIAGRVIPHGTERMGLNGIEATEA